jgi:hypothetical protein
VLGFEETMIQSLNPDVPATPALLNELRSLIEQARQHVAQTANSTLDDAALEVGRAHSAGSPARSACAVWRGDFADTVGKIGA